MTMKEPEAVATYKRCEHMFRMGSSADFPRWNICISAISLCAIGRFERHSRESSQLLSGEKKRLALECKYIIKHVAVRTSCDSSRTHELGVNITFRGQ
jgi:hypothetical protein